MKLHQRSYIKTIVLAVGLSSVLTCLAITVWVFGADVAARLEMPVIRPLSMMIPIALSPMIAFGFAVAIGGCLSLYRDLARPGRP